MVHGMNSRRQTGELHVRVDWHGRHPLDVRVEHRCSGG